MKITKIGYREVKSLPGYNSIGIEIEMTLTQNDTREHAMKTIKAIVREELSRAAAEVIGDGNRRE